MVCQGEKVNIFNELLSLLTFYGWVDNIMSYFTTIFLASEASFFVIARQIKDIKSCRQFSVQKPRFDKADVKQRPLSRLSQTAPPSLPKLFPISSI